MALCIPYVSAAARYDVPVCPVSTGHLNPYGPTPPTTPTLPPLTIAPATDVVLDLPSFPSLLIEDEIPSMMWATTHQPMVMSMASPEPVPEPVTLVMMSVALLVSAWWSRRRRWA